jgi:hypothetical protein
MATGAAAAAAAGGEAALPAPLAGFTAPGKDPAVTGTTTPRRTDFVEITVLLSAPSHWQQLTVLTTLSHKPLSCCTIARRARGRRRRRRRRRRRLCVRAREPPRISQKVVPSMCSKCTQTVPDFTTRATPRYEYQVIRFGAACSEHQWQIGTPVPSAPKYFSRIKFVLYHGPWQHLSTLICWRGPWTLILNLQPAAPASHHILKQRVHRRRRPRGGCRNTGGTMRSSGASSSGMPK